MNPPRLPRTEPISAIAIEYCYKNHVYEPERAENRDKSRVRSKIEHLFQILKLKFGFVKVHHRGLEKNANRLFAACALVSLFVGRRTQPAW